MAGGNWLEGYTQVCQNVHFNQVKLKSTIHPVNDFQNKDAKLSKVNDKERILKAAREKRQ